MRALQIVIEGSDVRAQIIALGIFAIGLGIILFLIGTLFEKDKLQDLGFGLYISRKGWMGRAILLIVIGIVVLVLGLLDIKPF